MKYNIKVKNIYWLDEEIKEADVLFLLNSIELNAFSHPCEMSIGEEVEICFDHIEEDLPIDVIFNENPEKKKGIFQNATDKWSYEIYGQIRSIKPVVLDCGNFDFQTNIEINDETILGEFIYYPVSRLDIIKLS